MNENEILNQGIDPNSMEAVTQPPMPPSSPRMPQSVEAPYLPTNDATIEQQIAEAKKLLGVDALESELNTARAESLYKDNLAEILGKYPELTKASLEAKLNELDDQAKEFYKSNKGGLDMFAKSLKETIAPKREPDEITDDSSTSASGNDEDSELEKRVKAGTASSMELGEYINKISK